MRAPFVVTLSFGAAAAASAMACGLDTGVPLGGTDAGTVSPYPSGSSGTVGPQPPPDPLPPDPVPACDQATIEPVEGTTCYSAGNVTCPFADQCVSRPPDLPPTKEYVCAGGLWQQVSARYVAACPTEIPTSGSSCLTCLADLPAQCTYGDDSGCPPLVATCDHTTATWSLQVSSCNPPAPIQDGGANPGP